MLYHFRINNFFIVVPSVGLFYDHLYVHSGKLPCHNESTINIFLTQPWWLGGKQCHLSRCSPGFKSRQFQWHFSIYRKTYSQDSTHTPIADTPSRSAALGTNNGGVLATQQGWQPPTLRSSRWSTRWRKKIV